MAIPSVVGLHGFLFVNFQSLMRGEKSIFVFYILLSFYNKPMMYL